MKEKIPLSQIIKNTFFMIRYAAHIDPLLVIGFFVMICSAHVLSALLDTVFIKGIIDQLSNDTPLNSLLIYMVVGSILITFVEIINACFDHIMELKMIPATQKIQAELLSKAAKMDLICYDHSEYFDNFILAASQSENSMMRAIGSTTYIVSNCVSIISVGIFISTINPVVAIFPVLGFFVNIITRFKITKLEYNYDVEQKTIRRKADYSRRVFYQPEYAKEIKLTDIYVPLHNQFEDAIKEERKMARGYGIKIAILSLINWIVVFTLLSYFCLPLYLGYLALVKLSIALGDVASMNNAANIIRNRLDGMNYALVYFQQVGQYAEKFRKFIDYEIKIEEHEGTASVPKSPQSLAIKHLTFRYEGADHDSLRDINMTIHPGEKIAIVGENGAGKTTLVKLLMHLYDATSGEIRYGDHNINDYGTKEYRNNIGAVFQDYQIYAATLAENVMMGEFHKEDETLVRNALSLADFDEKLARLPNGIHTELTREFSEEGSMLSGGESQKVAVARMFAKTNKLSIAILDEPSSALDPIAEYTLNTNMMEAEKESTIIFISHRLSTTRNADRIYLFEHGQIIEQGTHDDLMKLHGEYEKMFSRQAKNYRMGTEESEIA